MEDVRPAWSLSRRVVVKSLALALAIASRTYLPYALLGVWNRAFGGWRSVFFCYAGSRNYIASYAAPMAVKLFRWVPSPIGVLTHNGARGLVLAAPVTETEFLDPANARSFRRLQRRLRLIARLTGVEAVNLAGILPGVLRDDEILDLPDIRATVAAVVRAAVGELVRELPIILLGGAGHIGRPTGEALRADGLDVHVVDPRHGRQALPEALDGSPCLLVDVSRRGVIGDYIPQMWPALVVLNETFPRPASAHVDAMTAKGVEVYHLSGVAGSIYPPLPFGYENAVPCCAAHGVGDRPDVRIVRLGGSGTGRGADLSRQSAA